MCRWWRDPSVSTAHTDGASSSAASPAPAAALRTRRGAERDQRERRERPDRDQHGRQPAQLPRILAQDRELSGHPGCDRQRAKIRALSRPPISWAAPAPTSAATNGASSET